MIQDPRGLRGHEGHKVFLERLQILVLRERLALLDPPVSWVLRDIQVTPGQRAFQGWPQTLEPWALQALPDLQEL